jgi:hypothetical protein
VANPKRWTRDSDLLCNAGIRAEREQLSRSGESELSYEVAWGCRLSYTIEISSATKIRDRIGRARQREVFQKKGTVDNSARNPMYLLIWFAAFSECEFRGGLQKLLTLLISHVII